MADSTLSVRLGVSTETEGTKVSDGVISEKRKDTKSKTDDQSNEQPTTVEQNSC